ncbi:hypothetical protein [Comamonas terrae]|uniref:Uncharacterized protein n=1 Tax=Comamonas terrae TaxID=673548 RepID=A0ABW5URH4_9BURK|nr:hypothetical protein [Comamonas terrae]
MNALSLPAKGEQDTGPWLRRPMACPEHEIHAGRGLAGKNAARPHSVYGRYRGK